MLSLKPSRCDQLWSHRSGEAGYTLTQLLVGAAIGGLVIAIASSLATSSRRGSVYQNRLLSWQQQMIAMTQSVRKLCAKSDLADVPIMTAAEYEAKNTPRPVLKTFGSLKLVDTREPIFRVGPDPSTGIEIKSISLLQESEPIGSAPPVVLLAVELEVNFRPAGDPSSAAQGGLDASKRVFRIPLVAKTDPATRLITECSYSKEDDDKICKWVGGRVDPATNGCAGVQENL